MLSFDGIVSFINDDKRVENPNFLRYRGVYYGMSLHISGICPAYQDIRNGVQIWNYPVKGWYGWEYQLIFDISLFSRYPTEPEITRNFRYSQYRPYTQEPFQKCIQTTMGAIFQDSNYSIMMDDRNDNDYIWGNNFEGKNLIGYIKEKFQNVCEDPNGVFVIIPKYPRYETTSEIEPEIFFIQSRFIKWHTDDEIIFEMNEYVWAVNRIGYFRFIKQEGKYIHVDEAFGGYYTHLLGRKPIVVAGGVWNTQGYYESWLNAAKPIADEYVIAKSDESMAMKQASFPRIVEAAKDCPDCEGGWVQACTSCHAIGATCGCGATHEYGSNLERRHCGKCGGSGQRSSNPGDVTVAPAEKMNNPLVQFISPPVEVPKLHIDRNKELYHDMLRALHLNYIEQAQSGVAKDKDMETRYQFLNRISDDLFDRVITSILNDILSLRNVTAKNNTITPTPSNYTLIKPTQFQIYTSFDLLEEYDKATKSGLPVYQLNAILYDFVEKRFGGDDVLKRKTILINTIDILANMNMADISIVLLNNGASSRDLQFHLKLPVIIDDLISERGDDWFLNTPIETLKEQCEAKFNAMKPPSPGMSSDFNEERVDV